MDEFRSFMEVWGTLSIYSTLCLHSHVSDFSRGIYNPLRKPLCAIYLTVKVSHLLFTQYLLLNYHPPLSH